MLYSSSCHHHLQSTILSFSTMQNGHILIPDYLCCSGKLPLNEYHIVVITLKCSRPAVAVCVFAGFCRVCVQVVHGFRYYLFFLYFNSNFVSSMLVDHKNC